MERQRLYPFPEIPKGNFPDEIGENKITLENTTLFNQSALGAVEVVRQYRVAKNNSERKNMMRQVFTFSESDYPTSYETIHTVLANQIEHDSQRKQVSSPLSMYESLDFALVKEFQPPDNVKIHFQFQPHVVRSIDQERETKDLLTERLRETFTKEGDNIFFKENSNTTDKLKKALDKATDTLGTFTDRLLFLDYFASFGKEPDVPISLLRPHVQQTTNETAKYDYLVMSLLDTMQAEGYAIKMVLEDITPEELEKSIYQFHKGSTIDDYKSKYKKRSNHESLRDKVVIDQLKQIAEEAQGSQKQTNIFVLRGSAHAPMMAMLPKKLAYVSSSDNRGVYPREGKLGVSDLKNYEILMKLRSGEKITETEWEELYASYQ